MAGQKSPLLSISEKKFTRRLPLFALPSNLQSDHEVSEGAFLEVGNWIVTSLSLETMSWATQFKEDLGVMGKYGMTTVTS